MYEGYQNLKIARDGAILTIQLSNPSARNAVNASMHDELGRVFKETAADEQTRMALDREEEHQDLVDASRRASEQARQLATQGYASSPWAGRVCDLYLPRPPPQLLPAAAQQRRTLLCLLRRAVWLDDT